jgi:large subunit ribosomal protein L28
VVLAAPAGRRGLFTTRRTSARNDSAARDAVTARRTRRRSPTTPNAKDHPLAAVCEICGKGPLFSYQGSFSNRRSKRRWNPNIQRIRVWDGKRTRRADVCTSCMKAGKVQRPPQRTV